MADKERAADSVLDWIPLVGIGPVRFGESVEELSRRLALRERSSEREDDGVWAWYDVVDSDASILTVDGLVMSVDCPRAQYRGVRLDGLSEEEVPSLFAPNEVTRKPYPKDTFLFVEALSCVLSLDEDTRAVSGVSVSADDSNGNRRG
jgi:hypothetical protein